MMSRLPQSAKRSRVNLNFAFFLLTCNAVLCIYFLGQHQQWLAGINPSHHHRQQPRQESLTYSLNGCNGWKATFGCIPYGPRQPDRDKTCAQQVNGESGYCLCAGNVTVASMSCGSHRFHCYEKCAELTSVPSLGQPLPKPLTCRATDGYDVAQFLHAWAVATTTVNTTSTSTSTSFMGPRTASGSMLSLRWSLGAKPPRDPAALNAASGRVWGMVNKVLKKHAPTGNISMGPRTGKADWVMEGQRINRSEVARLAGNVAGLLSDLPPYSDMGWDSRLGDSGGGGGGGGGRGGGVRDGGKRGSGARRGSGRERVFSGRGVVMVGGGPRYLTPAWVSLHVLRRSGCFLPVELWFPVDEFPTPDVEAALGQLGVVARKLAARDLAQRGFGVKIAALLLSSFQEVLFLDSDNAVLRDPTHLFDTVPYRETGALLWPDYWDRTAAHEIARILNISTAHLPRGTFESGQMVIDKARHWRGLLVATYMNVYSSVFSELLSCYVGKGDKETFAYGMLAAGEPLWLVPYAPGSAGVEMEMCGHKGRPAPCRVQFLGNTMVQHDTEGSPLFFHANYQKWDLALPEFFDSGWNRRWRVLQPGRRNVAEVVYGDARSLAGYDIERFVYDVLRAFRCAGWFPAYMEAQMRRGELLVPHQLDGFHVIPDYTTFRDYYSQGWSGRLAPLVYPPLSWFEHVVSWYFRGPRWWMRPWERRLCRWRRKLLPGRLGCKL